MKAFLQLFFFFSVLLTSGTSLECESCLGIGNNCSGNMVECAAGLNTCAMALSESTEGAATYNVIVKGCTSSDSCNKGAIYANYGHRKYRGNILCCNGSTCGQASPKLPPINNTANGKHCPACYVVGSSCVTEVVNCTGSEDYCLDAQFQNGPAHLPVNATVKGCVSAQICSGFESGLSSLGRATKGYCRPADKGSPTSGSVLLVLSGLLVMKVF